MKLVNRNCAELLMLEEKLMSCVDNKTDVSIHYHNNEETIRVSVVLDNYKIENDSLYLTGGWFSLNMGSTIVNVECEEEEDSVHIEFENGAELYVDSF